MLIYKTTNLINGKIYIGQKPSMNTESEFFNSDYYGSGRKIRHAIECTGITSIYHCLDGKYKMAGGFLWKYSK